MLEKLFTFLDIAIKVAMIIGIYIYVKDYSERQELPQKPTVTTSVKSIQVFYNRVIIQGKDTTYYFEVTK